jgi:hypothetical protein
MRFSAASLVASLLLLAPVSAPADPAPALSRNAPLFTAGHWLGKGWFTATSANSTAAGLVDGDFTFDLSVGVSGLVVGRLMMSTTGSVTNAGDRNVHGNIRRNRLGAQRQWCQRRLGRIRRCARKDDRAP